MERYRLLPQEAGMAISVPHAHRNLITSITRETPFIHMLEAQGERRFGHENGRWGLGNGLRVVEGNEETTYVAEFFTSSSHRIVTRSLHILTLALSLDESGEPPLVALEALCVGNGNSAHDMSVELSPRMVRLLEQFGPEHHRRIEDIMRITVNRLGDSRSYPFTCSTRLVLSLVVPGEETWLACDYRNGANKPAYMGGHNIDHSVQQFALLAGLAEAQAIAEELDASS